MEKSTGVDSMGIDVELVFFRKKLRASCVYGGVGGGLSSLYIGAEPGAFPT